MSGACWLFAGCLLVNAELLPDEPVRHGDPTRAHALLARSVLQIYLISGPAYFLTQGFSGKVPKVGTFAPRNAFAASLLL